MQACFERASCTPRLGSSFARQTQAMAKPNLKATDFGNCLTSMIHLVARRCSSWLMSAEHEPWPLYGALLGKTGYLDCLLISQFMHREPVSVMRVPPRPELESTRPLSLSRDSTPRIMPSDADRPREPSSLAKAARPRPLASGATR